MAEEEEKIIEEGDLIAEEKVEGVTVESKGKVSQVPSEVSKENTYTCSLCGASVVPEEIQTPTGIGYKCRECKKFMKPLAKKEVAERGRGEETPTPLRG